MTVFINLVAFVFVIGVIIFIHELGHFAAARMLGIRVRTFSVGMGPQLWGIHRGGTHYRLAAIPLGGYVAFSGIDRENPTGDGGDFIARPRWQRMIVLLAGPAANVVLSVALVAIVLMVGTELAGPGDLDTEIGAVAPESAAEEAGLLAGDVILSLDGDEAPDWRWVSNLLLMSPDRPVAVEFEREGQAMETVLVPRRMPRYELGEAGLFPSLQPRVQSVNAGSPADLAGLRYGDTLYTVDGLPVADAADFRRLVEPRVGEPVEIEVGRAGRRLVLSLSPVEQDEVGRAGITIAHFSYQRLGPVAALVESTRFVGDTTTEIFSFIGGLLQQRVSARSALAGPIEISRISGAAARRSLNDLVFLIALISLNICILNLLPIPVLDGGQLMVLTIESALRRDLSLRVKSLVNQLGIAAVLTIMVFALYFDLARNLPGIGAP